MCGSASKRVCIVGAGPAGLAAARWLSSMGHRVQVLEQSSRVGGAWNFIPNVESFPSSLQTSMYSGLITNLSKHVMQYSDWPFPDSMPMYPSHHEVATYLESYAMMHELFNFIKFKRHVRAARWLKDRCTWQVSHFEVPLDEQLRGVDDESWMRTTTEERCVEIEEFDALCICNGHFWDPFYPSLPGLDQAVASGSLKVFHSHLYRTPDLFLNEDVLIVGGGFSGLDITYEISRFASSVHLSLNQNAVCNMVDQLSEIIEKYGKDIDWSKITKKGVVERFETSAAAQTSAVFEDGSRVPIDVVLFCTGYFYSYPFLDSDIIEQTRSKYVRPIYKQLLHPDFPNGCLSFIALPKYVYNTIVEHSICGANVIIAVSKLFRQIVPFP